MRPLESQDPFGPLSSATVVEHFEQDPPFLIGSQLFRVVSQFFLKTALTVPDSCLMIPNPSSTYTPTNPQSFQIITLHCTPAREMHLHCHSTHREFDCSMKLHAMLDEVLRSFAAAAACLQEHGTGNHLMLSRAGNAVTESILNVCPPSSIVQKRLHLSFVCGTLFAQFGSSC